MSTPDLDIIENGQPVPQAPQALIDGYSNVFHPDSEVRNVFPRIFDWIHTFSDPDGKPMTSGDNIQLMYERALKGNTFATLACCIIWNHNQETWLWNRMSFHALADIQGLVRDNARLLSYATLLKSLVQAPV